MEYRVAVYVHLYYADLHTEVLPMLGNVPQPFDLYVNVTDGVAKGAEAAQAFARKFPTARVFRLPNQGRDIGPLFEMIAATDKRYDAWCFVHGKKSTHNRKGYGDTWRRALTQGVLGSGKPAAAMQLFQQDYSVGLCGCPHWVLGGDVHDWDKVLKLCERAGFFPKNIHAPFIAGTMWWAHGSLLEDLKRMGLRQSDFEATSERGLQYAHAFERFVSILAWQKDLKTVGL